MPPSKEKQSKHAAYMREYRKSPEARAKHLAEVLKYQEEHPGYLLHCRRIHRARIKAKAYIILGCKCRMCGATDPRVLTLNHINGDGHVDKKAGIHRDKFLRQIIAGERDDLELLCWNCQFLYRFELGEFPKEQQDMFFDALREEGW